MKSLDTKKAPPEKDSKPFFAREGSQLFFNSVNQQSFFRKVENFMQPKAASSQRDASINNAGLTGNGSSTEIKTQVRSHRVGSSPIATTLLSSSSGNTMIQRWAPPVRADELGPGQTDRLGARTFDHGIFSIFISAGAAALTSNTVHVFFSPGDVTGAQGSNAVLVHGLRSAADPSQWILISVPGVLGGSTTITNAQIISCLLAAGRPGNIDSVRMSAHSRGAAGLAATLRRRLITPSLINHVTILDATDHQSGLTRGLQQSQVPPSRVTAYNVVFGGFSPYSIRPGGSRARIENIHINATCIRSIGYARLISDGIATGRAPSPLPPGIASRIAALTLPPRGSFTTITPTPSGKISFNTFCSASTNTAALAAMLDGEPSSPTGNLSWRQKESRAPNSPYAFIEHHNVMGFNNSSAPRRSWNSFNPQIYRHHLFVAEFAHELFR